VERCESGSYSSSIDLGFSETPKILNFRTEGGLGGKQEIKERIPNLGKIDLLLGFRVRMRSLHFEMLSLATRTR
jgi:hypothetical protein